MLLWGGLYMGLEVTFGDLISKFGSDLNFQLKKNMELISIQISRASRNSNNFNMATQFSIFTYFTTREPQRCGINEGPSPIRHI